MPQLRSGRLVGVALKSLVEHATEGSDEQILAFVASYRLSIQEPLHLRNLLPVLYVREGEGEPSDANSFPSGYPVQDVLAGDAGWLPEEIEEFIAWLDGNQTLKAWLEETFAAINVAIIDSPLWKSDFMLDD